MMTKISFASIFLLALAPAFSTAQNFDHKTLISGMGNFAKSSSTTDRNGKYSYTNSSRILQTELSAVYFLSPKIGLGFSGSLNNTSYSYTNNQTAGLSSSSTVDSTVTRESGGALRLDIILLEKNKFSLGIKSSAGTYIVVSRSVYVSQITNPPITPTGTPVTSTSSSEDITKGNVLRISVAPVLYYEISKHVLLQLQYSNIYYSKTNSEIMPPAAQNSTIETAYGLNLNYLSVAIGLSLRF